MEASTCVVRAPLARSTAVASSSNRCGPTITWQSRIRIRPLQLESLGSEGKIPRTYKCRPTSKNVGLFAFYDTFPSVSLGFGLSKSPGVATTLGEDPMIRRQSFRILAANSRCYRSLLVIRLYESCDRARSGKRTPKFHFSNAVRHWKRLFGGPG